MIRKLRNGILESIAKTKENKKVFLIFMILNALVVFSMVRQFIRGDYENFALCILTMILLLLPGLIQVKWAISIPIPLQVSVLIFIFAAEILGEIDSFYTKIPFWDTMLHTINGFLAASVGFSLATILNDDDKITVKLSPFFVAIVAFSFSMTIGVIWEFIEFFFDMTLGLDMQKDTIVHTISSIALNPDGLQKPVRIAGITSTVVNGQDLGINGYLDIGLIDTMKDLIVNFIGAITFSFVGYLSIKIKGKYRVFTDSMTVNKASDEEKKKFERLEEKTDSNGKQ